MPLAARFLGVSPQTAQSLQGDVNAAVSAAGTTLATATLLQTAVNIVTTATALQGVKLQTGVVGDSQIVWNNSGVSITVYPSSASAQINQIAAGGGMVLADKSACEYVVASSTQHIALLSA